MSAIPSTPGGYIPPTERSQYGDLSTEEALSIIPWKKFQFNPHYAGKQSFVLISSGSFSPITVLHTQLMETIRDYIMIQSKMGQVLAGLLSPVHDLYGKPSLIPQQHRLEMCRLATNDFNWLGVTEAETAQKRWLETRLVFDLLHDAIDLQFSRHPECKKQVGDVKLVFCMGSDVLLGFKYPDWWSFTDIEVYCTKYRLAVILREQDKPAVEELLKTHPILSKYPESIFIIPPIFQNSISSTLIRNQLQIGGSIHGLVHPKVEQYIYANKLYIDDEKSTADIVETRTNASSQQYIPLFPQNRNNQ